MVMKGCWIKVVVMEGELKDDGRNLRDLIGGRRVFIMREMVKGCGI